MVVHLLKDFQTITKDALNSIYNVNILVKKAETLAASALPLLILMTMDF